jgi:hypothetical protein
MVHDYFLDLGYGGGIAIQYDLNNFVKVEMNATYSKFIKASQNLSIWTCRLYYVL